MEGLSRVCKNMSHVMVKGYRIEGEGGACWSHVNRYYEANQGDRGGNTSPATTHVALLITLSIVSPSVGSGRRKNASINEYIAKKGDIVTPGTKVVVIAKSDLSATHAAPPYDKVVKDSQPPSPAEAPSSTPAEKIEKQMLEGESPAKEKPVSSPASAKSSPSEPQLPPGKGKTSSDAKGLEKELLHV